MRTLTVTGHGAASAAPDTAVVRLSAVHRAGSLAEALSGAESARAEVVAAAGDLVVSTMNLSVWPVREEGQAAAFEARHSLTVAAGDLEAANDLLSRLAASVGDRLQVDGVDLTVKDPSAALGRAREAAFADARATAEHLAALADTTLGQVESLAEGGGSAPPVHFAALGKQLDVGLQPGETTLSASLTVTWSLG
ncbi:SIMPL domain-containing protein [Nocardioides halotolerans]|uniref:SIMPL domain-containing protein n=1 Tax=Nocardioides halotolerans TaxID=433660 RepID=UPI000429FA7F|nr:SIMPL domain-containing protein [Nocardioides halotolerans]